MPLSFQVKIIRKCYRLTAAILSYLSFAYQRTNEYILRAFANDYGVSESTQWVIDAESLAVLYSTLPKSRQRIYFEKLAWLKAMRTVFDAVALSHQHLRKNPKMVFDREFSRMVPVYKHDNRPNSQSLRGIWPLKERIVRDPYATASEIKSFSFECREYYFGTAGRPTSWPIRLYTHVRPRKFFMDLSYLSRAMPAPHPDSLDNAALIKELTDRLSEESPPEPPDWRQFCSRYLSRYTPPVLSAHMDASNSACVGYKGSTGGHVRAYQDYVLYGLASHLIDLEGHPPKEDLIHPDKDYDSLHDQYLDALPSIMGPGTTVKPFDDQPELFFGYSNLFVTKPKDQSSFGWKRADGLWSFIDRTVFRRLARKADEEVPLDEYFENTTTYDLEMSSFLNEMFKQATLEIFRRSPVLPVVPVVAPEKGMKTRMPTASLTAVNVVQQALRRCADCFLKQDPRIAESLGSDQGIELVGEPGPWYSQDLSTATDTHPFWMERVFYEEMRTYTASTSIGHLFDDSILHKVFGPRRVVTGEIPAPPIFEIDGQPVSFQNTILCLLRAWYYPRWMTFFPQSSVVKSLKDFYHKYNAWIDSFSDLEGIDTKRGAMMGEPTSWALLPIASIYCAESIGLYKLKTTGDDALIPSMHPDRVHDYNNRMASIGGIISERKTFIHEYKGVFCEQPYIDGYRIPYYPLSIWAAPAGGSKGEMNWYSQSTSFKGHVSNVNQMDSDRVTLRRVGLYKYSPFIPQQRAAVELGLPLGAEEFMGGISHPHFPTEPTRYKHRWMDYLSGLPLEHLFMRGGLPLVKDPGVPQTEFISGYRALAASSVPPTEDGMPLKDAVQVVRNLGSVTSLFLQPWPEVKKSPNLYRTWDRYVRTIHSRDLFSTGEFTYAGIKRSLNEKMDRVVPYEIPKNRYERNFGFSHRAPLYSAPKKFRRPQRPG